MTLTVGKFPFAKSLSVLLGEWQPHRAYAQRLVQHAADKIECLALSADSGQPTVKFEAAVTSDTLTVVMSADDECR